MKLLNVHEAAKELGVNQSTVYRLCQARKILHRRIGTGSGRIVFTEDDLAAYLASCVVPIGEPEPDPQRPSLEEVRRVFRPQGDPRRPQNLPASVLAIRLRPQGTSRKSTQ